jgi:hypothetical protein
MVDHPNACKIGRAGGFGWIGRSSEQGRQGENKNKNCAGEREAPQAISHSEIPPGMLN